MKPRIRTFARQLLIVWAGWTLLALFAASRSYLAAYGNTRAQFWPALRYSLVELYVWAALTPLVLYVCGRLVIRRANWWRNLPGLAIASIVFTILHVASFVKLLPLIGYRNTPAVMQSIVRAELHSDILTCWALFGLRHAMEYYRQAGIRELKASQLEAKLALSQLEVLKMQLQPHFLFNTLHAISALMYRNLEAADRMIARLSDFLRLTLDSAGVQEVTLKREMEYLDKYLEIEQVRFGERLEVRRAIEPGTLDLLLPNLVLQPLAENAVRHGIAPRAGGGRIEVAARIDQSRLVVEVVDDGPGPSGKIREGLGLSNTRARLEQLYGEEFRLELTAAPQGGFRARLTIPAHSESMYASPDHRR
jgi:signal transduction histidine kinase